MLLRQEKCQTFSFLKLDIMTFLVSDITYLKKNMPLKVRNSVLLIFMMYSIFLQPTVAVGWVYNV
jgi:hypothetical protein